jgi:hypothetical protein
MVMDFKTGTAAELMKYRTYHDTRDNQDHETRAPTTNQQWVIQLLNGQQIIVTFERNFAKKHLFTFSKKDKKIEEMVEVLREFNDLLQKFPKGPDLDKQLHLIAHRILLERKLKHTLEARAEGITCRCGHVQRLHLCTTCHHDYRSHRDQYGNAWAPCAEYVRNRYCNCRARTFKCVGDGCACTSYVTKAPTYHNKRVAAGKGDNPLYGMPTDVNTAIILNKVTKTAFESVVTQSIIFAEHHPPQWNVGDEKYLKWNFGAALRGCVVTVDLMQDPDHWPKLQGVWVLAKKLRPQGNKFRYEVSHMGTSGRYAPF